MTIMPAASIAMSQSATLPPFPTETILLSAITTVSPRATGAARSPLRIFPMLKTATFIASVAPSVGILHGDSGDASQPLVRGASGLLEALFHDNERAPGAKLHGMILTFGFRRSCALSADLSIQYADDAVCADRTKQNRMLNFNVEDRVGTIVIERASAGNAFTEAMV